MYVYMCVHMYMQVCLCVRERCVRVEVRSVFTCLPQLLSTLWSDSVSYLPGICRFSRAVSPKDPPVSAASTVLGSPPHMWLSAQVLTPSLHAHTASALSAEPSCAVTVLWRFTVIDLVATSEVQQGNGRIQTTTEENVKQGRAMLIGAQHRQVCLPFPGPRHLPPSPSLSQPCVLLCVVGLALPQWDHRMRHSVVTQISNWKPVTRALLAGWWLQAQPFTYGRVSGPHSIFWPLSWQKDLEKAGKQCLKQDRCPVSDRTVAVVILVRVWEDTLRKRCRCGLVTLNILS